MQSAQNSTWPESSSWPAGATVKVAPVTPLEQLGEIGCRAGEETGVHTPTRVLPGTTQSTQRIKPRLAHF